jgi:hypothetical protein
MVSSTAHHHQQQQQCEWVQVWPLLRVVSLVKLQHLLLLELVHCGAHEALSVLSRFGGLLIFEATASRSSSAARGSEEGGEGSAEVRTRVRNAPPFRKSQYKCVFRVKKKY